MDDRHSLLTSSTIINLFLGSPTIHVPPVGETLVYSLTAHVLVLEDSQASSLIAPDDSKAITENAVTKNLLVVKRRMNVTVALVVPCAT
jgi:hypothetical protein